MPSSFAPSTPRVRRAGAPHARPAVAPSLRHAGAVTIRRTGAPHARHAGAPTVRRSGALTVGRAGAAHLRHPGAPITRRGGLAAALALVALLVLLVAPGRATAAEPLPVPWSPVSLIAGGATPDAAPGVNDFSCRPAPGTRPVVLVHGLGATLGTNWATFGPLLKNNGFCVFGLTYGRSGGFPFAAGLQRMEESSAELAAFVDRVLRETGAEKVDLLGHSEGTVMPRWFLSFRGGAAKVDRYVQLTPLWNGTNLAGIGALVDADRAIGLGAQQGLTALLSPLCGSCVQFARGSDYLNKVNQAGPAIPGIRYTGIATKYDELVIPYQSGLLGAPNVKNIVLQDVCPQDASEHLAVAYSPNVAQLVLNALAPDRARPVRCVAMLPTGPVGSVPEIGLNPRAADSGTKAGTATAPAAACVSRRRFAIRVRPTTRAIRTATVRVDGRRVTTRRTPGSGAAQGRRSATIDLRRAGARTVVVRTRAVLRARDARGRAKVVTDVRRYRVCGGA